MNRPKLIADFAEFMAESMDMEALMMLAQDTLRDRYEQMTDGQLLAEVREFAPNLIATTEE